MFISEVISFQSKVPTFQEYISFFEGHTKLDFDTRFEIDSFRIENRKNNWVVVGSFLRNEIELSRGKYSLNYLDYASIYSLCKLGGHYNKMEYIPHWAKDKLGETNPNYFFKSNSELNLETLIERLEANTNLKILYEGNILKFKVKKTAPKEMKLWLGDQKLGLEIRNNDLIINLPDFEVHELFGAIVKVLNEHGYSSNFHKIPSSLYNCSFKFWSQHSF